MTMLVEVVENIHSEGDINEQKRKRMQKQTFKKLFRSAVRTCSYLSLIAILEDCFRYLEWNQSVIKLPANFVQLSSNVSDIFSFLLKS